MVARVIPRIFSGTIGGALADRFQPQQVLAACSLVQGAFTVSIVPSARIGAVWAVYGAVVLAQFAGGLARPAAGALVPRVAPPDGLQQANALYSLAFSSSIAVGPALAAPLLAGFGVDALLLIDGATFAVASVLLLTLGLRGRAAWAATPRAATTGLRAVWSDNVLRTLAFAYFCGAIAVTAASSVLVLVSTAYGSASRVGYLYAAVGGGSVAVGVVVLRYRPKLTIRDVVAGFAILEVLCLAVVATRPPFWSILLVLALSGGAGVVWQTWGTTDMQMRANPAFLGRVNGVMVVAASAGMLVGALLALALVPWAGWERTLFIACCVSLLVLAAGVVLGPQQSQASD
jgi:predicted MFS family arabinose efflux permease